MCLSSIICHLVKDPIYFRNYYLNLLDVCLILNKYSEPPNFTVCILESHYQKRVISRRAWNHLHPLEQKIARTLQGKRKISFVGGRIAARLGLKTIQQDSLGVVRDSLGAPIMPTHIRR